MNGMEERGDKKNVESGSFNSDDITGLGDID